MFTVLGGLTLQPDHYIISFWVVPDFDENNIGGAPLGRQMSGILRSHNGSTLKYSTHHGSHQEYVMWADGSCNRQQKN